MVNTLTLIAVVLVLLGIITLMFRRKSGVSLLLAAVLAAVVASMPLAGDLLVFVAIALAVVGLETVHTAFGKVMLLAGVVTRVRGSSAWRRGVCRGRTSRRPCR